MTQIQSSFYTHLSESDIEWIHENSKATHLSLNQFLLNHGEDHINLYILQEGLLGLKTIKISQPTIIELYPGELIGDVFFLGSKTSSSDVVALENSKILSIPLSILSEKLQSDKLFELSFYKGLSHVINNRLNNGYRLLNRSHLNLNILEEANDIWDEVVQHTNALKKTLQEANNEYLKTGNISTKTRNYVEKQFQDFSKYFNRTTTQNNELTDNLKEEIGRRVNFEILPYLLLTNTAERMYVKPNGYAGDYLMLYQICENQATGKGALGEVFDKCWLNASACEAVRNRRVLLKDQILQTIKSTPEKTNVLSIACGPALEIFDCYQTLSNPQTLKTTLIEIDRDAVSFVEKKISEYELNDHVKILRKNLVFLAKGKDKLDIPQQDLIYSAGMMDYFSDKAFVTFLDYFYELLKPNGRVIIGNFHPRNDSRALMDYILDWRLIHRSEEQISGLFSKSAFKDCPIEFVYEAQQINLFAICTKK